MPGTDDLDNNGTWSEQPDVGPVWYPNDVPDDWAPYSDGYWSSIGPWGWTWIGYEPWGFAPYHYGRWGFGTAAGGVGAPARELACRFMVQRLSDFSAAVSDSAWVGSRWVGESRINPWYHCGPRYIERVNVRNTFIRNRGIFSDGDFHNYNYAYAHNVRAVTATSRGTFTGGTAIRRGTFHVTEASLRGAQVTNRVGFSLRRKARLALRTLEETSPGRRCPCRTGR